MLSERIAGESTGSPTDYPSLWPPAARGHEPAYSGMFTRTPALSFLTLDLDLVLIYRVIAAIFVQRVKKARGRERGVTHCFQLTCFSSRT